MLFEGEEIVSLLVDVFDLNNVWVVYVVVLGVKKWDVGVYWDKERGVFVISGVIYRFGDEEFLKGLVIVERMVGLFEKKIKMLFVEMENSDVEVDVDGISVKLEDGVLFIVVFKKKKEKGIGEIKRI